MRNPVLIWQCIYKRPGRIAERCWAPAGRFVDDQPDGRIRFTASFGQLVRAACGGLDAAPDDDGQWRIARCLLPDREAAHGDTQSAWRSALPAATVPKNQGIRWLLAEGPSAPSKPVTDSHFKRSLWRGEQQRRVFCDWRLRGSRSRSAVNWLAERLRRRRGVRSVDQGVAGWHVSLHRSADREPPLRGAEVPMSRRRRVMPSALEIDDRTSKTSAPIRSVDQDAQSGDPD